MPRRWPAAIALAALLPAGAAIAEGNVEEARVTAAAQELALELDDTRAARLLLEPVRAAEDPVARRAAARAAGQRLWQTAVRRVQQGSLDDRPLYWQRLAATRAFRAACDEPLRCSELLDVFERASRGIDDLAFPEGSALHVAISGFDPFGLDTDLTQSNPSGVAALSLDGAVLEHGGATAKIQALMLPVRFADFDAGLVESAFGELLRRDRLDLLVTISMGREQFDLERYPGRRRSSPAPDNLGVRAGAPGGAPLIPRLGGSPIVGQEFVEFSLPAAAMLAIQDPYPVRDNAMVTTVEQGSFAAPSLQALQGQTAVSGSGGGYLSNEVSYRTVRLVRAFEADIPVGHLHTPRVAGHDPDAIRAITGQVRRLLEAAVGALGAAR